MLFLLGVDVVVIVYDFLWGYGQGRLRVKDTVRCNYECGGDHLNLEQLCEFGSCGANSDNLLTSSLCLSGSIDEYSE